jgi:predicted AAA+ superfamily ATPase
MSEKDVLFLNRDDPTVQTLLSNVNTEVLKQLIGKHAYVFIDEAQRIDNIGSTLKLITDQIQTCQLIVSGSSAFELRNATNEPLTGRKWEYQLFPISWTEFETYVGFLKAEQLLETRLIFGFYPEVITQFGEEREILIQLSESYLYKDLYTVGAKIKRPELLPKILQALAYQVGNEVSHNEIAQLIGADNQTVTNYIDLLIKSYVVFPLHSFSRNLRNEIKAKKKYYFYDNGIRNAVISNFSPISLRNDIGALWENFLVSEKKKENHYQRLHANTYFWRTTGQQEIDYLEEMDGHLKAFEFKWNPNAKWRVPKTFLNTYQAQVFKIDRSNFRSFISPPDVHI